MLNVEKLKTLRDAKMKQDDMATELNMSQSNYSKIENGEVALTLPVLEKIAKILAVSPIELLNIDKTSIQLNSNNNNGTNNSLTMNDTQKIQHLYEKLLAAKEAELVAAYKIIELNNKRIQDLETALQKYNL